MRKPCPVRRTFSSQNDVFPLQSGKLLKDVADIVLYDEKAVRRWIRNFVAYDYEGLIDKEGRGQKPRLPKDQEEEFKDELDHDKVEVWWQDESRVGQQGSLSRVWASKGTRPRVVRQR